MSVHSAEENDFVANFADHGDSWIWLGGERECDDCPAFRWSDGTPWDYENWKRGEPNNWVPSYTINQSYHIIYFFRKEMKTMLG